MDLAILDFILLVIIFASAIYGAFKGFISQIVSIASLLLGVWCAFKFSDFAALQIKKYFEMGETAIYIASFILILVLVIIAGNIIGRAIEQIIHFSLLGWLNRLLGIIFSAAKWVIIMSLIAYVINYINASWHIIPDSFFAGSHFYPQLTALSEKIFPYLQSIVS
jgi:membrane protein required for colicin V production